MQTSGKPQRLDAAAMIAALVRLPTEPPGSPELPDALGRLANSILREAALDRGARLSAQDVENLVRLWTEGRRNQDRSWAPLQRDYSFAAEAQLLAGPVPPAPPARVFAHVLRHADASQGGPTLARRLAHWGLSLSRNWKEQTAKSQAVAIRSISEELEVLLDRYLEVVAAPPGGFGKGAI